MRRIINRLVVVRAPEADLVAAAEAAAAFADRLDTLRARTSNWEVSEAGLEPGHFIEHSPLSGLSNPLAPPMHLQVLTEPGVPTVVSGTVMYGAAYEGPPGHVHGGMVAAMFDELLGFAQFGAGFTGTLTIRYRKPTPLHTSLTVKAWLDRESGRKRIIKGTCHNGDLLLSEAEGLFIAPRAGNLREALGF